MAGNASIVVDIKAQITGYQEQIEKIKSELKKIDPGSSIGKSLNNTLAKTEQKLAQLSRNAEQRITSQGQLTHLFDQLHAVSDLMRNLGQGMTNVGLEDVLATSSEKARELGNELKQLKTDMNQKGASFFDELKKTNPKELQSVFDQLKLDPKTTGIDEFVEKVDTATKEAKQKFEDLTKAQEQARREAENATKMTNLRSQLPQELQNASKISQADMKKFLGSNELLAQSKTDATTAATQFLAQIRAGLDVDNPSKDSGRNAALQEALKSTAERLTKAKDEAAVQRILNDLQAAINQNTQKDVGGSKTISELTGGINLTEWAERLTAKAEVDKDFETKIRSLISVLTSPDATAEMQTSGSNLSKALENLLDPNAVGTFKTRIDEVVRVATQGMKDINTATQNAGDPAKKSQLIEDINKQLGQAKIDLEQLEKVKNTPEYQAIQGIVSDLSARIANIEQKLGIENSATKGGVAEGIRNTGVDVARTNAKMNNAAINSLKQYSSMLEDVSQRQQMVSKVEGIAQRWFSVYAAVRMISKAFNSVKQNVQGLDKTITEIAIVTNMSQSDLWGQMPEYTAMARKYGATLQGVYEVSQLYYQQGLEQDDVMALTEQTLKMARISGLDYGEATNYMTNAIRSFKIEMQDAQRVVDVYSALAASSASSTSELATAMSKTASSAAAVGSSFEATSAMMAVMIETTRESPENIGSALKSIISRYGELKENKTGIDEEGEEYSLNKVDTALQSVGISIHDAKGEFRDFDDVIMELAQSWDTIDTNTQRYIATVMAGNRQQSRFLALVSNGERLAELNETAENSEDASALQVLKTMDSIDYKSQQLQTSLQSLYTSTGVENLYKGILDGANAIVTTFTNMPTIFSAPIPAIISLGTTFLSVANIVMTGLSALKQRFLAQSQALKAQEVANAKAAGNEMTADAQAQNQQQEADLQASEENKTAIRQTGGVKGWAKKHQSTLSKLALAGNIVGTGLTMISSGISERGEENRAWKGVLGTLGSTIQDASLGFQLGGPWGALAGGIIGLGQGIFTNMQYWIQSTADQAKRLQKEAEEDATAALQKNAQVKNLEDQVKNWKELKKLRTDSAEAEQKFLTASNQLASDMPDLISYYDNEGNAVLSLANAYDVLIQKREEANQSTLDAAISAEKAAHKNTQAQQEVVQNTFSAAFSKQVDISKRSDKLLELLQQEGWASNGSFINIPGLAQFITSDTVSQSRLDWGNGNTELAYLARLLNSDNISTGLPVVLQKLRQGPDYIQSLREEAQNTNDTVVQGFVDLLIQQFQDVQLAIGEEQKAAATQTSTERTQIAKLIQGRTATTTISALYGNDIQAQQILDLLDNLDVANGLAVDYVMHEWQTLSQGLTGDDYDKAFKEFVTNLTNGTNDSFTEVLNILSQVNTEFYDELDALYEKRDKLTRSEFTAQMRQIFSQSNMDLQDENVQQVITAAQEYYNGQVSLWEQAFGKDGKGADWTYKFTEQFNDQALGVEEQRAVIDQIQHINRSVTQSAMTSGSANQLMSLLQSTWSLTNAIQGPQKDLIQAYLTNLELTSDSVQTIIDDISKDVDLDPSIKNWLTSTFNKIFQLLPSNLTTALNTYIDTFSNASDDYTKWLQKSTEGMSLKEASELAALLQISPTDSRFQREGTKILFKDTAAIYDKYFGDNGIFSSMEEKVKTQSTILKDNLSEIAQYDFEGTEEFHNISANDMASIDRLRQDAGMEWGNEFLEYYASLPEQYRLFGHDYIQAIQLDQDIKNGRIKNAIKDSLTEGTEIEDELINELTTSVTTALKSGDFQSIIEDKRLSKEFKDKLPEMKVAYDEAQQSLLSGFVDSISDGYKIIEINEYNRDLFESIYSSSAGHLISDVVKDSQDQVTSAVIDLATKDIDEVYNIIASQEVTAGSAAQRKQREQLQELKGMQYERSTAGTLSAIVDSYDNVSMAAYEEFKDAWKGAPVQALFKRQADGSYKANLPLLAQFARQQYSTLDEMTRQSIEETLTKAIDDGASAITGAADYITKGTTRYQDMADFVKQFNEVIPNANASITDLFKYDTDLSGYTLNAEAYKTYLTNQKAMLMALGEDTTYIDGLIETANQTLFDAVDIKSYIDSEDITGKSRDTLKNSMKNVLRAAADWESEVLKDYIPQDVSELDTQARRQAYTSVAIARQHNKNLRQTIDKQVENDIKALDAGGQAAIEVLKAYAGNREISTEEIEATYRNRVNDLQAVSEVLGEITAGSVVSKNVASKLNQFAGFEVNEDGVVTAVGDMIAAYQAIYDEMTTTAGRTTADLNAAYADLLTAQEQGDIDAIEAMGDAMGMTYSALGEILAKQGISLEKWMDAYADQGIYEKIGAGKIRITDFTRFAAQMGWEPGSEEYTSAFKSYNDALIEMNQHVKDKITDEITQLKEAKGGEQFNFTDLWTSITNKLFGELGEYLEDTTLNSIQLSAGQTISSDEVHARLSAAEERNAKRLAAMQQREQLLAPLLQYGASFKDGILTLSEHANIPAIMKELQSIVQAYGESSQESLAAFFDALNEFLASMNDLIGKGIEGSLSNLEANQLTNFGQSYGLDLNFTKTAEGLKLTQASAISLYQTMKSIDALQGRITFEKLMESMTTNNENYRSMTGTLGRIQDLSEAINAADSNVSHARLEEYRAELAVAQEILAVRSGQEDTSMNFMDNDIPGAQKNPINYMENWGKAWNAIKDSFDPKKNGGHNGMIKYQDWYNIANELGHIAQVTGNQFEIAGITLDGSLEKTAALIQKGADSLTAVDSGELLVSLPKMGVDFASAAGGLGANIDDGIHEIAQAEVDMLDGIIRVLEMIVAMEKLGNIDADNDMTIEMPEIGITGPEGSNLQDYFVEFTDTFKETQTNFKSYLESEAGKDANLALESVSAYGHTLKELIINATPEMLQTIGIKADMYTALVDGLYKLSMSNDYNDTDDIIGAMNAVIASIMGEGFEFSVDTDKLHMVIKDGAETWVSWDSDSTKKALEEAFSGQEFKGTVEEQHKQRVELAKELFKKQQDPNRTLTLEEQGQIKIIQGEITVTRDENNKPTYKAGTRSFGSLEEATLADKLFDVGVKEVDLGLVSTTRASGTMLIAGQTIGVTVSDNEDPVFVYGSKPYTDIKALYADMMTNGSMDKAWNNLTQDLGDQRATEIFQNSFGMKVLPTLEIVDEQVWKNKDKDTFSQLTSMVQNLHDSSQWKEIETMAGELGIKLNPEFTQEGNITADSYNQILEALGIDTLTTKITTAINDAMSGDAGKSIGAAISEGLQAQLTNDVGELEVKVPEVKVSAEKITIDLSKVTPSADGELPEIDSKTTTQAGNKVSQTYDNVGKSASEASTKVDNLNSNLLTLSSGVIVDISGIQALADILEQAASAGERLTSIEWETIGKGITAFNAAMQQPVAQPSVPTGTEQSMPTQLESLLMLTADNSDALDKIQKVEDELKILNDSTTKPKIDADNGSALTELSEVATEINKVDDMSANPTVTISVGGDSLSGPREDLEYFVSHPTTEVSVHTKYSSEGTPPQTDGEASGNVGGGGSGATTAMNKAMGTIGLAHAKSTLMGELGPELVVSGNKYFVAGQSGPEFVDLDEDAIVFNHLQTQQLLKNGMSPTRGRAITNERNAVAFARGNVDMNNRPIVPGDVVRAAGWDSTDDYSTVLTNIITSAPDADVQLILHVTPILANGKVLTGDSLQEYVERYLLGDGTRSLEDVLALDKQGLNLVIGIDQVTNSMDKAIERYEQAAEDLHEAQADIYDALAAQLLTKPLDEAEIQSRVVNDVAKEIVTMQSNALGNALVQAISTAASTAPSTSVTTKINPNIKRSSNNLMAQAKGTLMGELGPELVVQNGRYFVAGQSGSEFVDLAKDAIVFNHLQTQQLLKNGISTSRGQAVTNERNAVAFAKGSLAGGPAMASASAALAALRQLRAQWAALTSMSVQDLAGAGGGGGGGGGNEKKTEAFIKNLDRWYKLLQKIARLEKDINREEERRNTIAAASTLRPEGDKYFQSQARSLELLKEQRNTQLLLAKEQKAYFKEQQAYYENEGAFSALYSFDDYGQLTYRDGAYEKLAKLFGVNELGKANYTVEQQYEQLVAMGYGDQMIYDTSGNEIDRSEEGWQQTAVQTLWDKMEAEREEMQSLYDSYNEKESEALQSQQAMDEIISEMRDNQIDLEKKVLDAVVELRERAIEQLEEEKDAIESASNNMINGLTEQLEKERDMYQHQQDSDELGRLQRQLGILQRSGGSGSQISSLRSQIKDKTQQLYFDTQQEQIDALQEAVDTQIDRLNEQIDLMKEELEYEKEHGLLWNEVKEIMKNSPEDITNFIMENTAEYWGQSSDEFEKNMASNLYSAQQWTAWRDNTWSDGERKNLQALVDHFVPVIDDLAEGATAQAEEETTESSETTAVEDDRARREREARERQSQRGPSEEEIERMRREAAQEANRKRQQHSGDPIATQAVGTNIGSLIASGVSTAANSNKSSFFTQIGETVKKAFKNATAITGTYDTGGIVDEDKFALVHAKEAVLTPEQTKMFREDLLGQSSNSALRQLQALRDEWSQQVHNVENTLSAFSSLYHQDENGLSYNPQSSGFSVWIENAAVNMNVEKLANDYDAQRAGEQALEKMLQIARKTSGWNRIGG